MNDEAFSRANSKLRGATALYVPKCKCRCDTPFHSITCTTCELMGALPMGSLCLVDSAGNIEMLLPEKALGEYPEEIFELAENVAMGNSSRQSLRESVSFKYFGAPAEMIPVRCFEGSWVRFLRGDMLRVYAEFTGMRADF